MTIAPFGNPVRGLDPVFVRFFNLTPAEAGRLAGSIKLAQAQYDSMVDAAATGGVSDDGKTLTVTVPSFPAEGGAIHDELLGAFEQVLGPDRFALFNVVTRDQFEQSFNQFGLGKVTYAMELTPTIIAGARPIYKATRATSGPDGSWGSSSGSVLGAADVKKYFPAMSRFLPPDFGQPGQP